MKKEDAAVVIPCLFVCAIYIIALIILFINEIKLHKIF